MNDLRFALRQLLKSPGFTLVAILTLALGIGANTAIFSLVNALLLKPLPYPNSPRIVQVSQEPVPGARTAASGGVFMDWQDHATSFEYLACTHQTVRNLTGVGEPVRLSGLDASADYLRVLGIQPKLGRFFLPEEDGAGNRHVMVITEELWRSQFNTDPAIIGRAVQLDSEAYTVIGVLPAGALLANNVTFLVPTNIRADAWKQSRDFMYVTVVIGRLKAGATMEQAAAELNAAKQALRSQYPSGNANWGVSVQSLQEAIFGPTRPYVFTLLAAVGAVLLIACANVGNLLLAKASARQGEIAVRSALGATPRRLIRQLLTESLLLALAGGTAGVLLGSLAIEPLIAFTGVQAAAGLEVGLDRNVLLFALGISVGTGLLFGLFPALSVSRTDFHDYLKDGSRGSTGGRRRRLQSILIVVETALTVVLLASAGLLLRSFVKALNAEPGFNKENVLVFDVTQAGVKAPTIEHRLRFVQRVLERVEQIPGVTCAGMISSYPMNGANYFGDLASREDKPETRNDLRVGYDAVAGHTFQALGIPLLQGRLFTEADNALSAPKVMVISESLSRIFFGDESPLGRQVHFKDAAYEVVGVVGSVRRFQLDVAPGPQIYFPQAHFPWANSIVVRTKVPPLSLVSAVRGAVLEIDPEQPIARVGTLEQAVGQSLSVRRVVLTLLGLFAGAALLLACIGIYGVMAYAVTQRTREMGIRIALGAQLNQVIQLVLSNGMKLVAAGVVIGVAVSLGTNRLLTVQLYNVTPVDPVILTTVTATLLATAALACWIPARRATRVDPVVALRAE